VILVAPTETKVSVPKRYVSMILDLINLA